MSGKIVREALNYFINDLRSAHGDNLASVVLYGSVAAGDTIQLSSDYNLLIALRRITPEDLRTARAPVREWQRLGHPLPVYFTVAELRDATDVFPIEFHDMERSRLVLFGDDPFESLQISDTNLRHQTEYELRSKLIQLRRLYITASPSAERLVALMSDSIISFATLFAPVLMLSGVEPPPAKRDCVRAAVQHLQVDGEPFERIFELRAGGAATTTRQNNLTEKEANDLFAAYLAQIERVIGAVDLLTLTGEE